MQCLLRLECEKGHCLFNKRTFKRMLSFIKYNNDSSTVLENIYQSDAKKLKNNLHFSWKEGISSLVRVVEKGISWQKSGLGATWAAHLENSVVGTGLERSVFTPIPKKGNAKECSDYQTIALISHASKVMFKVFQARLQQYMN